MTTPGRLLAARREADIFDLGDGSVLRRYKRGGNPEHEAVVMEHARAHGFPAPLVLERRDGALVLERIDGPSMGEDLVHRPWRLRRHAQTLACELPRRRLAPLRDLYVRSFLSHFDRAEIVRAVPAACELRLADANVRPGERNAVRELAAATAARSRGRRADRRSSG